MSVAQPVREAAPPRPEPAPPQSADHRVPLAVAALCAAIGGGAALLLPAGPLRLLLVVAFDIVGPGAALMAHIRIRDAVVACALAVTASLSAIPLPATLMLWLGDWWPLSAHVIMLAVTAGVAAVRLIAATSRAGAARLPPAARHVRATPAPVVMPVVLLVGAVSLWLVAVGTTDAADVGAYGLTHALGAPFIVAVVAVCLAFAVELLGRSRPPVLAAGIVSITVMLRASAPLLLANVEYPWTYKHFGVVELIRQTGRIVDPADIYRLWPAFFATMAQLSDVTGVASIDYATWSSLLFSLIDALLLAAAVRVAIDATGWSRRSSAQTTRSEAIGLAGVRDNRIIFLTVFLFQACLWVDTNYFSPQAYAFALFLGFVVILRGLLYDGPDGTRRGLRRLWRRPATTERSASRLWSTVAAVGVFFVITATHQLSPYIVLVGVAALGVLGRVRPRIIVLLLGAVAFGYLAPRLGDVLGDYGLLSGFNPFRNASGNAPTWGSAAQRFSALLARGLALTIWATALLTLWRQRRQPSMVTVGILAFSPFVILGAQSYGGEAIYRVFLFSLPWCALLIAAWLVDGSFSRRRRLATAGIALMLSAFSLAAHQGLQG